MCLIAGTGVSSAYGNSAAGRSYPGNEYGAVGFLSDGLLKNQMADDPGRASCIRFRPHTGTARQLGLPAELVILVRSPLSYTPARV